MKLSIITATYNSAETIKDCIDSVKQQTYSSYEHIIIDGASTDETLNILNQYTHLNVFSEPDQGIYDAMNKGIARASGDLIAILNSDDFYANAKVIEDIVKLFELEKVDAIYADLNYVDPTNTSKTIRKWKSGKFKPRSFYNGWMPPHPTFVVKKELYQKYGNFNLDFKTAADYELMLRFIEKHKIKIAYLPKVTVLMRMGGLSNSSLKHRIFANKEDRKAWQINGLKPKFYTLYAKPIRKIKQYFI